MEGREKEAMKRSWLKPTRGGPDRAQIRKQKQQ